MKLFISGATHGIGKATVRRFLEQGWEVYGCASNREDEVGLQMEQEYQQFHFKYADVSKEKEFQELADWFGRIDAAINNAGIGCVPQSIHCLDIVAAQRVIEVNLLGTAIGMKYETSAMRSSGSEVKPKVIVNCSSIAAYKASTGANAMYSASKAGVLSLTCEAAAQKEYYDTIKFFAVVPGYIETRMTAMDDKEVWKKTLPSGRVGTPEETASFLYRIITHADCFDSGQIFQRNGGGIL